MTLDAWIAGHARFQPDKAAVRFAGQAISYQEFDQSIARAAGLFAHVWHLQRGDRIAFLSLNHPDIFVLLFTAARLGLIVVPLNWRLAVDELKYIVAGCQPKVMFHDNEFSSAANRLTGYCPGLRCVAFDTDPGCDEPVRGEHASEEVVRAGPGTVPSGGGLAESPASFLTLCASAPRHLPAGDSTVSTADPYLIVYTSGTTGRPKGAVLTQQAVICNAGMSQHAYDLTVNDHVLNVLPLFHVGGINIQALPALMHGGTVTLHARFDATAVLREIEASRITLINTVPTILQAMLGCAQWQPTDLASLKSISIGSTDVPVELIEQVHARGVPLIQIYGATETCPIAIYQRTEHARSSVGSIGRCGLLCQTRLVDSAGQEVSVGDHGEIQIKGDNVMSHYWNDSQATTDNLVDGWFKSGDIARCDTDENYWFSDRLKHVIISGGENIYAAEIERILRVIPGVREVSVVGVPDKKWGEIPVAVVVIEDNGPNEAAILAACDGVIAHFKRPKRVVFTGALPRNALGKVQVVQVRQLVTQDS